jgi:hypothetical protein
LGRRKQARKTRLRFCVAAPTRSIARTPIALSLAAFAARLDIIAQAACILRIEAAHCQKKARKVKTIFLRARRVDRDFLNFRSFLPASNRVLRKYAIRSYFTKEETR